MRTLLSKLKRFFFPPANTPAWLRVLPYVILGLLTVAVLGAGSYTWQYTNSSEFCGTACHTMPPEYSAYLVSPHARVQCVECHIGRDVLTTQFTRKAGDLRHVVLNITEKYEFPIRAHQMRPARESCETCHFPEKFSDDSLREIRSYTPDKDNTLQTIFLVMKTGGGTKREGLGRGIHWHVENEVWFMTTDTDHLEQEIPYVRVVDDDGQITEYYDVATDITPDDVAGQYLERMDCITCHNRITHRVPQPEIAVDQAIRKGLISPTLPYVRREAVALLRAEYPDKESAIQGMDALTDFYAENYPKLFDEQAETVEKAVATLQSIYENSVFPEQKSDWDTHPDNLGHKDDPGCFRCHDGKHLTPTGEAIRLECNICHSIPITSAADDLFTNIEITSGPEPVSHTHSSWIALHGKAIDRSCATCHEPVDPTVDYTQLTGKPPTDGSFCGNDACHSNVWTYTGFDSPALASILEDQLFILQNTSPYLLNGAPLTYESTFKAIFDGRCIFCHGPDDTRAGLDVSTYQGILAGGDSGPGIVPGDLAASLIVQRQSTQREHFGQMLDDELEALREWVLNGAP